MHEHALSALGLTFLAGGATAIGSLIALVAKESYRRFFGALLGFSAGVMLWMSFRDLLPSADVALARAVGERTGRWLSLACFLGGLLVATAIDFAVPHLHNPHEAALVEDMQQRPALRRLGTVTAVAIAVHNFPEGIATMFAGLRGLRLGLPVALAVALHNVPEGIAVAVPIYLATGDRKKAFRWSAASGLAEPLGGASAYLLARAYLGDAVLGGAFAAVAGIMTFLAVDQLLPTAKRYSSGHASVYGLLAGLAVMAVSIELLR